MYALDLNIFLRKKISERADQMSDLSYEAIHSELKQIFNKGYVSTSYIPNPVPWGWCGDEFGRATGRFRTETYHSVYFLFYDNELKRIGQTQDIRERMKQYLKPSDYMYKKHGEHPNIIINVSGNYNMWAAEEYMLYMYKPQFNKLPKTAGWKKYDIKPVFYVGEQTECKNYLLENGFPR